MPSVVSYHKTSQFKTFKIWRHGSEPAAPSVGLTGAQRAFAGPFQGADVLPAGHPHGQGVLVIRRDPGRTQNCHDIQAEGEEHAHQPDQLQRRERGPPHLLCAAQRRSHAGPETLSFTLELRRSASFWTVVHDQHSESGCSSTCHLLLGWRVAARPERGGRWLTSPRWKRI